MAIDPDMNAAELALGLLHGEERAAALRRMLAEPDFAHEVEEWRYRLSGLFDEYREVAAPDFASIAARLDAPVRRTRSNWPVMAVVTGLAALLILFFSTRPEPAPREVPHQVMVASLMLNDKSASIPAFVDATTGEIRTASADIAPAGKSAELWMIGPDGVPQAIGLLATTGPSHMTLPPGQRAKLGPDITLAVSIEPIGGSPIDAPTGPVVATGQLSNA